VSGRSYLFVLGNRPDRFEKARSAGADAVILDLEDVVPSEKKTETCEAVSAWLSPERPAYVRVNGTATPWFWDDLEAVARPGLAGVVLPKAEDPDEISEVTSRLPEEASVLPLLETAAGVWDARALAEAHRVERLAFGSIDFRLDAGIDGEAEELLYARSRLILASRVAGILPPLDGVTAALDDPDRLAEDVDHARRLGFGGKLCIHPEQIEAVNRGFVPSEAEALWARRVLEAAGAAAMEAVRFEGEMIDRPVIERARGILARVTRQG
jgi:citrate lyase subunit beta / citryl-CoA lyase